MDGKKTGSSALPAGCTIYEKLVLVEIQVLFQILEQLLGVFVRHYFFH